MRAHKWGWLVLLGSKSTREREREYKVGGKEGTGGVEVTRKRKRKT